MLLGWGADPTAQAKEARHHCTLLRSRAMWKPFWMLLVQGADPTAQETTADTTVLLCIAEARSRPEPLHFASWRGNAEAIHMLLERGADPTAQARTADTIDFALQSGNVEAIWMLLEWPGGIIVFCPCPNMKVEDKYRTLQVISVNCLATEIEVKSADGHRAVGWPQDGDGG
ncbi:hypothetical protein BC826DRAFT_1068026 [Russula brevipes]|nr:hypothetical protein BC826DRAFT_1068026 [Russula brevipes]